jgi:hypothetical protein
MKICEFYQIIDFQVNVRLVHLGFLDQEDFLVKMDRQDQQELLDRKVITVFLDKEELVDYVESRGWKVYLVKKVTLARMVDPDIVW